MLIAIVNGLTVEQIGNYQDLFPNTSFPASGPTPEWMEENSCMPVSLWVPYDPNTQYLESVTPYIDEGYVYTVQAAPLTPEMIAQRHQSEAAQNKTTASNLLSQTDWTALSDVADPLKSDPYLVNQAEFVSWRSQIRAIAVSPTWDAVFPPMPPEVWSNQPTLTGVSGDTIATTTASETINV